MTELLVVIPIGYLLGAVPIGLIVGKVTMRVDVRNYGSGRTGMTNVMRTVGTKAAVLVLLLDMGKAILAVFLAKILFDSPAAEAAAGVAAVIGHNWPVFIGFRGGRGTASAWGGLLILSPLAFLAATIVGVSFIASTRYMSLGSISATIAGTVALIVLATTNHAPGAYIWFVAAAGGLVVVRHKDNIERLLKGEERKLGQRAVIEGQSDS